MGKCSCRHSDHMCASQVPIFAGLEPHQLASISSSVHRREYRRGELISLAEERSSYLHIVRDGHLKLLQESSDGKAQTLYFLQKGDFFTEPRSFLHKDVSPVKAVALEDTRLCLLHKSDLKNILRENPEVGINILDTVFQRLKWIENMAASLTLKNAEQRLAAWLCQAIAQHGKPVAQGIEVTIPCSRYDIANLLGTTQETVSRRLAKLQAEGILQLHGQRKIIILNPENLAALAE
ncbi:hypothetical protein SY88_08375 [Clostridiales bacterium PH28_bin88]|nr:hypothetical protein SY88_08375 [Clostridiales bacterium PH28_bin88]